MEIEKKRRRLRGTRGSLLLTDTVRAQRKSASGEGGRSEGVRYIAVARFTVCCREIQWYIVSGIRRKEDGKACNKQRGRHRAGEDVDDVGETDQTIDSRGKAGGALHQVGFRDIKMAYRSGEQ